jgi:hypothetical protein
MLVELGQSIDLVPLQQLAAALGRELLGDHAPSRFGFGSPPSR